MHTEQFAITEEGQVYRMRDHARPPLLGQIACLIREETRQGRDVHAWWAARLTSDEPGENIVFTRTGEFYFVCAAEVIIVERQGEQLAPAQMVAD